MRQTPPPLGLADIERHQVEPLRPGLRQRKKRIDVTGKQFEFDFADRLAAIAGA
jgi:hypothetical protein